MADALESTPGFLMLLRDSGILKAYTSPELARYPEEAKTKADGARVYWTTDREAYLGFGYNTRMIAPTEVPKTFQDLLRAGTQGQTCAYDRKLKQPGDRHYDQTQRRRIR